MALLEAKNLSITFGGLKAVDDFNVEIEKRRALWSYRTERRR